MRCGRPQTQCWPLARGLYWQQSNWGLDETLPVIRLDIDPEEINRFRHPACALLGDAAVSLRALAVELNGRAATWQPNPDLPGIRAAFAERLARQEPPMGFLRAIRLPHCRRMASLSRR